MITGWVVVAAALLAADAKVIPLWEGRVDKEETFVGPNDTERRIRNVTNPTLTVHLPARGNGTAVVIAPGGGFRHLAIDKEGHDVAKWLNTLGIAALVLKYSAGGEADRDAVRKASVADARQAMRVVTGRAAEWTIDPQRIGFMGFSAGGNLAVEIAMRPEEGFRPAFVIPIYPAAPSEIVVPADAPPAFFAAANDDAMTATNVIALYAAWSKAKRPAALNVFTTGGHGFGIRKIGKDSDQWPERLADWLRAQQLVR